jgi:hypothetical protein
MPVTVFIAAHRKQKSALPTGVSDGYATAPARTRSGRCDQMRRDP